MSTRDRVAEIFAEAADLPTPARDAYLAEACGDDATLRKEVDELLGFDRAVAERSDDSTLLEAGCTRSSAPDPRSPPLFVGRFEVERVLGKGGMGIVYLARDTTLARRVAVKLVRGGSTPAGRARLLREAQAMARITHPNVVSVFEVGVTEADVFIAMEYVEGVTLTDWLVEPRTTHEILEVYVQAGRGLAAAHQAGVLHRDFTPQNVLVGNDGRTRVLDFGLARPSGIVEPSSDQRSSFSALDVALTQEGTIMGTPGYMSPEHFEGRIGPASDQWSYAAALYRAIFKERPFQGNDLETIRRLVLAGEPPKPPPIDVEPEVQAAILRGLSRDPRDRFASLGEMLDVLEEVLLRDPEQDSNRFVRQRRTASLVVLALVSVNVFLAGVRTDFRYDIGVPGVLWQGFVGLVILVAVFVVFRRTVFQMIHHRKILTIIGLPMAMMTAHRLYALTSGASVEDVLRTDAIFSIGILLYGALFVERWLAYGALVMALYIPVSYLSPRIVVPCFGVSLWTVAAISAWCWPQPGRRSTRQDSSSRSRTGSGGSDRR